MMSDRKKIVVALIAIALLGVGGLATLALHEADQRRTEPCSAFRNTPVSDVPLRCLSCSE